MKTIFRTFLNISILMFVLSVASYGAKVLDPNIPSSARTLKPDNVDKQIGNYIDSDAVRAVKAELRSEMYKDSVDSLKWALGIIIGLVVIFVGYAVFKDTREYRQAVSDAKQALSEAREATKEARDASDRARECEVKAQERLSGIDEQVTKKLTEIEAKGQALITNLIREAEKQRELSHKQAEKQQRISELYGKYQSSFQNKDFMPAAEYLEQALKLDPSNAVILSSLGCCIIELARGKVDEEVDKLYNQACQNFKNAVATQADYYNAWNNWGVALGDLAETKHGEEANEISKQACEKYEKAVQIKQDYYEAWSNWGSALLVWGQNKSGDEADDLFKEACAKLKRALAIEPSYSIALNNLGGVLLEQAKRKKGTEADKLFTEAYKKLNNAVAIKPDYYEAWNNWAAALLFQAAKKQGLTRKRLLDESKQKSLKAESIKTGSGAYNLACVYAQLSDEKECQKWLKTVEEAGTLPEREKGMSDPDLENVRDKAWFKKLRWKG